MKNLKIVISGAVGSGKTTLAKELANHLKIESIDENFEGIFKARQDFIKAQKIKLSQEELKDSFKAWMDSYFNWIKKREGEYHSKKNFVADRWEADLLSFWLRDFASSRVDGRTLKLISLFKTQSQKISHSVVLPPMLQVPDKNEAGLVRTKSLCTKIMGGAMMYGLIRQYTNTPLIFIPPKIDTVAEKIIFIERFISAQKN
jgi:hypothetical protein